MTDKRGRLRALARGVGVYAGIVLGTVLLLDVVLMVTGLFPPPVTPGHPELGWVSVDPTGEMEVFPCYDPSGAPPVPIQRNERGHRTAHSSSELEGPGDRLEIAVTGDSHTDLCFPNDLMHFGVLETSLRESGLDAAAYSYGSGRYSPLQQYLALRQPLEDFESDVLVMNLYTGNDFYDILRVDDRPYFRRVGDGYEIARPVWYQYDAPDEVKRSRSLALVAAALERVGVLGLVTRLRYLSAIAEEQGRGIGSVIGYINDLRHARTPEVGYQAAFAAQMLNQQLFFHRFPASVDESLRRTRVLMELVRERHTGVLLVMSPIPSYQLVGEQPVDGAFLRLLDELPITYDSAMALEARFYEELETIANETGWVFVDNLAALRSYDGGDRLYNDFDYHIGIEANEIIGRSQAEALMAVLGSEG